MHEINKICLSDTKSANTTHVTCQHIRTYSTGGRVIPTCAIPTKQKLNYVGLRGEATFTFIGF